MLPAIQISQLLKNLNIKKEKNAVFFIARLEGWIKKNENSQIAILRGINKILNDIHIQEQEKELEQTKKINLDKVKNNFVIKYAEKIIELHEKNSFGARRIQNFLWENHRAKVSHSTINRFLKLQKQEVE